MRYLIGLLLAALVAYPALAVTNAGETLITSQEVSTAGGAFTKTITNVGRSTAYLVIKTENETPDASLVVTVTMESPLGDMLVCTSGAITTNTSTVMLLGSTAAAAEGIDTACDWALGRTVNFIFTVTGASADFDVSAELQWVVPE